MFQWLRDNCSVQRKLKSFLAAAACLFIALPGKIEKRTIGDIVKIPLGDGTHAYARVLPDASLAFHDSRGTEELAVEDVVRKPILFFAAVMDHAIKKGRWPIAGHVTLNDNLQAPPRFIQNAFDKSRFEIYENGRIRPATRHECVGLERMAVWEPEHVEDRLRDHYAGRTDKWSESLKMR